MAALRGSFAALRMTGFGYYFVSRYPEHSEGSTNGSMRTAA
jgi:hypothetical protein